MFSRQIIFGVPLITVLVTCSPAIAWDPPPYQGYQHLEIAPHQFFEIDFIREIGRGIRVHITLSNGRPFQGSLNGVANFRLVDNQSAVLWSKSVEMHTGGPGGGHAAESKQDIWISEQDGADEIWKRTFRPEGEAHRIGRSGPF
jgi:hypothetical protein